MTTRASLSKNVRNAVRTAARFSPIRSFVDLSHEFYVAQMNLGDRSDSVRPSSSR